MSSENLGANEKTKDNNLDIEEEKLDQKELSWSDKWRDVVHIYLRVKEKVRLYEDSKSEHESEKTKEDSVSKEKYFSKKSCADE